MEAAPELAGDVIALARTFAEQRMRIESDEADQRMKLARERAAHQMRLEIEDANHAHGMDIRLWYCQIGSLLINGLSLAVLLFVAMRLRNDSTVPALAIAGANGGVTAASLAITNSIRKSFRSKQKLANERNASGGLPVAGEGFEPS
jgi:hypothetical protein